MPKCKGCGADIIFIRTGTGKYIPCDNQEVIYFADKTAKTKVVTPNGEVISATFGGLLDQATGIGYTPHWSSCPNADRFRKIGG